MKTSIRLPIYNPSIGRSFQEVILKDCEEGDYAYLQPTRTNADGSVAGDDDAPHARTFTIGDLAEPCVNKFNQHHNHMAISDASIAAALNIVCAGLSERRIINACMLLVACGLSAGREAFPSVYVTYVERIGSFNGKLRENYDEIMRISDDTAEGLQQNYNLFMLKKQDALALRWLGETGAVRPIAGIAELVSKLKADPLECAPLWEPMRPDADLEYDADRQYDRMTEFMAAALKNLPGTQPK